jgi:hypothetical protein
MERVLRLTKGWFIPISVVDDLARGGLNLDRQVA